MVTIISYDEENRQESVLREIDGEDLCLFRIVIRVGGDGDLFIAMKIVGGIVKRCLGNRLDEALAGLELLLLQSGPGAGDPAQPAVLGLPDAASRKVSARIFRTDGKSAPPAQVCCRPAHHMDPCGIAG